MSKYSMSNSKIIKIYATEISSLLGLNNYINPETVKKIIKVRNGLIKDENDEILKDEEVNYYNTKSKLHNIKTSKINASDIDIEIKESNIVESKQLQNEVENCVQGTLSEPKTASLLIDYYKKMLNVKKSSSNAKSYNNRNSSIYYYDEGKYHSITLETKKGNKYKIVGKIDGKLRIINDEYIVEMKKRVNRFYYSARDYCQIATYGFLSGINKAMLVQNLTIENKNQIKIDKYNHDFAKIWNKKYREGIEMIIDEIMA